ncbi:hypothetical protein ACTHRK_04885 [Dietzia cercidiphylli]|uniref:hypothetical protein n=1 Tax=Dietzia cercidiphylli TaxID=498199 RepID=UPI003F81ACBA
MILDTADLPATVQTHELVATMVAGANARALRVAPCLAEPDKAAARTEAKLILVGAVQRWSEAGSGAIAQASAGPFQLATDTRQRTGYNLWPSEIEVLQDLCRSDQGGAFSVDTTSTGSTPTRHPFLTA